MKTTRLFAAGATALVIGISLPLLPAQSHQLGEKGTDLQRRETGAPLRETVTVAADKPIVDYAPGASSAAHHHARSAFIYVYVLSGEIRSAVDGEPAQVYRAREPWFENPGAHHRVSANASDTDHLDPHKDLQQDGQRRLI